MIAETGHFALMLALMLAFAGGTLPLWGAHKNDARLIALSTPLALGQFAFTALAYGVLTYAYVVSDFSVENVARNSHTMKPMLYKVAGVWGNHEGSLLFWAFFLTLYAAALAIFGRNLAPAFRARVIGVQSLVSLGFLLFLVLASSPFNRVDPVPFEGNGLNPLLQDPGLAFHPPMLYLGYVGFSIAFSFAIAALIEGRVSPLWAKWVRPWTLVAWSFLSLGIGLGSWWAYYELGWGGWWFWDPVENALLMPWLAGTALLHSVVVLEKRDALKVWTVLLAILTFSLSLIGTFLVRSGVVTSVHAFASDPTRGMFILGFLVVVIGGSLGLYAYRAGALKATGRYQPVSREGAVILNNLFMIAGLGTVFLGTLYPLFVDAMSGEKLTVGAPFFEATFVPLMLPVLVAIAYGPLLSWKKGRFGTASTTLFPSVILAIAGGAVVLVFDTGGYMTALGLALGVWIMTAVVVELYSHTRRQGGLKRLHHLPRAHWGMSIAHFALGLLVLSITASETWTEEKLVVMGPGDSALVAGYEFTLEGVEPFGGENYTALRGAFLVSKKGETITRLHPQERTYVSPPMQTSEAAIWSMPSGDLYAVLGEVRDASHWQTRLYFKPMIPWMWVSVILMALGGALAASDRRAKKDKGSLKTEAEA